MTDAKERSRKLREHLENQFDVEIAKIGSAERIKYMQDNTHVLNPTQAKPINEAFPEYTIGADAVVKSQVQEVSDAIAQMAFGQVLNSEGIDAAIASGVIPFDINKALNDPAKIMGSPYTTDQLLGLEEMSSLEYQSRRRQLMGDAPKPMGETLAVDMHVPETSMKTYLIKHIRSSDMPPIAPSIVFRTQEVKEPISLENLAITPATQHPFNDYTLAYHAQMGYTFNQLEFIRVYKLRGDLVMSVFAIDLFGQWDFRYTVKLNDFIIYNGIPRIAPGDVIAGKKRQTEMNKATTTMRLLHELSSDATMQYIHLSKFLNNFKDFDREVVFASSNIPALKNRSRVIQESFVEYTLDLSRSKRVKQLEREEQERAKYVKEEPKTREYERIAHKRTLQNGKVINVKGTTCNPGSPLGKVIKDYKL